MQSLFTEPFLLYDSVGMFTCSTNLVLSPKRLSQVSLQPKMLFSKGCIQIPLTLCLYP